MKNWVMALVSVGILFIIVLILVTIFGFSPSGMVVSERSDSLKGFVECLNNKDIFLFGFSGNMQVESQLKLFGSAGKFVKVVDCRKSPENCHGVVVHPSWEIDHRVVSSGLSLGMLSQLSGCKLD
jgi:hypothetical protein